MKLAIELTVLAVALASTPLIASAKPCPPPMKHIELDYYDHPHHQQHHKAKHVSFYHSHHIKMHPHNGQSAESSSGDKTGHQAAGTAKPGVKASRDITETAINAGVFSTPIEAIKAADLVETLEGSGPYTFFASIDVASAKIPDKVLAALNADKHALVELLTYHVKSGEVIAVDIARLDSVTTVQNSVIAIDGSNGASVVIIDTLASNGVVRVIDSVLIPKSKSRSYPATPGNTRIMNDQAVKVPAVALPAIESASEHGGRPDEWRKINLRKF